MTKPRAGQLSVLARVAEILDGLGVEFHLGGSFASSVHGEPRQTRDIDLVVALGARQVDPLVQRLGDEFYASEDALHRAVRERRTANLIHLASGVKVDIFVRGELPFDRSEFERATAVTIASDPVLAVKVKSPEDTVIRKLLWYRDGGHVSERQWRDVVSLLKTQRGRLDEVYLERWARSLDLVELLTEARRDATSSEV